jgi:hypothetical protein
MTDQVHRFAPWVGQTHYEYDFYSGSQVCVYFGDILVDEIVAISFDVRQMRKPIFGYASQYMDAVAKGVVMVEGSMLLNFKEAAYLPLILKEVHNQKARAGGMASSTLLFDQRGRNVDITKKLSNPNKFQLNRETIERRIAQQKGKSEFDEKPWQFYHQLAAMPDEDFEDLAEEFEDAIWGIYRKGERYDTPNWERGDKPISDENFYHHRRADQYPPFDILIAYGDMNVPAANHTLHLIKDAIIVGGGQTIQISGEPIGERYEFMARLLA